MNVPMLYKHVVLTFSLEVFTLEIGLRGPFSQKGAEDVCRCLTFNKWIAISELHVHNILQVFIDARKFIYFFLLIYHRVSKTILLDLLALTMIGNYLI